MVHIRFLTFSILFFVWSSILFSQHTQKPTTIYLAFPFPDSPSSIFCISVFRERCVSKQAIVLVCVFLPTTVKRGNHCLIYFLLLAQLGIPLNSFTFLYKERCGNKYLSRKNDTLPLPYCDYAISHTVSLLVICFRKYQFANFVFIFSFLVIICSLLIMDSTGTCDWNPLSLTFRFFFLLHTLLAQNVSHYRLLLAILSSSLTSLDIVFLPFSLTRFSFCLCVRDMLQMLKWKRKKQKAKIFWFELHTS